jgi:hypothetical protein
MPFGNRQSAGTIWLPTGNPDTTNIAPTDFGLPATPTSVGMGGQPGSLGIRFEAGFANRAYQRVQLDSGCTASTSVGVVAANMLAYWKDKANYIVTNDVNQANAALMQGVAWSNNGFRNMVAGIFRSSSLTPGNFIDILQRGRSISVKTTGSPVQGDFLVSDTSTSAAQAATVTAGTAPTCKTIGVVVGATVSNVTPCDVDIPEVQ